MTEIRFGNLTDTQRKLICNGCGKKGGWLKPPQFFFKASCDHHDFNYWLGYQESDREKADLQFYEAMKEDAITAESWIVKKFHLLMAWIYYRAVRCRGDSDGVFHKGKRYRTKEDLEQELAGK
jgi:Prokaryotic phospholipase A2